MAAAAAAAPIDDQAAEIGDVQGGRDQGGGGGSRRRAMVRLEIFAGKLKKMHGPRRDGGLGVISANRKGNNGNAIRWR
ncbi:hypothetical protein NL676_006148 [Syzygium grande]|nr:hypothetical protein NL676_006148 [Syzygium grande]